MAVYRGRNLSIWEKPICITAPHTCEQTEVVTRHMTIVNLKDDREPVIIEESVQPVLETAEGQELSANKRHLKAWWQPVLQMSLDDPEQEPPFWLATNNVVLKYAVSRNTDKGSRVGRRRGSIDICARLSIWKVPMVSAFRIMA